MVNIKKNEKRIVLSIICLGLLIRILLAPMTKGHSTDVLCFSYWADFVATRGLSNFYTSGVFVDYPPAYIYILFIIGKIQHLFDIIMTSRSMLFLIKMPSIFADVMLSYIIYKLAKRKLNIKMSLLVLCLYIFNPAVIINSAVWAQIDGFYTLFIVLIMINLFKDKFSTASVIYMIAVLIKPQALVFAPILLCAFVEKKQWRVLLKSAIYSVITALMIIIPFTGNQKVLWIIDKYKTTLSSYPYASINAFNLFALCDGNWKSYKESFLFLDFNSWSTIFICLITLFSIYIFYKGKEKHKIFYIAYFLIISVFLLSAKMHERYMFPALALGLLLYIYSKERRVLYTFAAMTVAHFINVAYVLKLNSIGENFVQSGNVYMNISAIINIILLVYVVIIGCNMYCKESTVALICEKCSISKIDYYAIAALIVLYSIIAFINLGSVKVPEKYWEPKTKGEYVIADLGEVKSLDRIYYFPGLGGGKYKVYASVDKNIWNDLGEFNGDNIYLWKYLQTTFKARYIEIVCEQAGGRLNEVGIFQQGSQNPLKIWVDKENELFDEQATVTYNPSYLNGMYFDEIYHARTAYEHLHRMAPYEWTHPPLGKLLISIGVFCFGMNPFGWRIIGTIIGIAMIPLLYLFALKIFKKPLFAFVTAFLLSFDFMHFTQTRIATIDVYAVFFILLMYYFMYQFATCSLYEDDFKKPLRYFMLSGISFGLGAATKWSCLYGGVGLAVILVFYIVLEYRKIELIKEKSQIDCTELVEEPDMNMNSRKSLFIRNTKKIILYGVVFFIVVPIILYLLSYIPYMLVPGSKGIAEIINYQKSMYQYHSTLVATHPFSSAWWEWPIIKKPIWYYTGQGFIPVDKVSSIVSMGNPAIWWTGIATVFLTLIIAIKEKDKKGAFILISIASQYVPWMFIPRLIFIYHYFATVPFMILSIVYVFQWLSKYFKKIYIWLVAYLLVVLVLFIMFYPIMSGFVVDKAYVAKFLRWFQSWYFY